MVVTAPERWAFCLQIWQMLQICIPFHMSTCFHRFVAYDMINTHFFRVWNQHIQENVKATSVNYFSERGGTHLTPVRLTPVNPPHETGWRIYSSTWIPFLWSLGFTYIKFKAENLVGIIFIFEINILSKNLEGCLKIKILKKNCW